MHINVVLPYKEADIFYKLWAFEEDDIDFSSESERAERCTVSFGAAELVEYLGKLNFSVTVSAFEAASEQENWFNIFLICGGEDCSECSFEFVPHHNGLEIIGKSRTGVLYGCYEFLKLQGIRWYAPGKNYEFLPAACGELKIPKTAKKFSPDMNRGRGFDFEGILKESAALWLFMARNRLNMASYRVHTDALMRKLGMTYKSGGHIFEKMLHPDKIAEDGQSFWNKHNDWYGTPSDGKKKKEMALSVQFCTSNDELIAYLAKNVIHLLKTEWKNVSRLDIWGFDTWGETCNCEKCRRLGNGTDKTLHFMSELRNKINQSDLGRRVELVMCAYQGTASLNPPINEIPSNLKENGDLIVFYPINRCYRHDFFDKSCQINRPYCEALEGWAAKENAPDFVMGEYYNVSKLEDLPLVFTQRIQNDLKYYMNLGVKGLTYMHVPLINHNVRAVNHLLYAELAWDKNADTEKLLNEYFSHMYGSHAEEMKEVYRLLEVGWQDCQKLRAWSSKSILSQLRSESLDMAELDLENHYQDEEALVSTCANSVEALEQALLLAKKVYADVKNKTVSEQGAVWAVNPEQEKKLLAPSALFRIADDIRYMIYGLDTMKFTKLLTEYHYKTRQGENTDSLWAEIEELYDKLDSYFVPITFDNGITEVECRDALTRTQLRSVADRYRMMRNRSLSLR